MRKHLVILRCGKHSLHRAWMQPRAAPQFDLVLCPYEPVPKESGVLLQTETLPGQKWTGLRQFLTGWPHWRDYDYIWLPDDDLEADSATINRLFACAGRYAATICAPALSEDSFYSHAITMHHRQFFARVVSFVEVMMPCLRRDVLELALPSMALSETGYGWGLDGVWPKLVNYQGMFIFDFLTVRHARPVGTARDARLGEQMIAEMHRIMDLHGATPVQKVIAALQEDGSQRRADRQTFLLDYLNGYDYLIARDPAMLAHLAALQDTAVPETAAKPGNLALRKPARMSSPAAESLAEAGNNGEISGLGGFKTAAETEPWWQVDLQAPHKVTRVILYNRLDAQDAGVSLSVSGAVDASAFSLMAAKLDGAPFGGADGEPLVFEFQPPFTARFVRITLIGYGALQLDEIEVYGALA